MVREGGEIKIWVYKRNPEPEKEVWGEALVPHFTAHALSRAASAPAPGFKCRALPRGAKMKRGWQRRWRRENEEMGDGPTWLNKEGAQWLPFSLPGPRKLDKLSFLL